MVSVVATGVVMAAVTSMPALAQSIEISDNGANSHNTVFQVSGCQNVVAQSSKTMAFTPVASVANTGGNEASANTGWDVVTKTGKAVSDVSVSVAGGDNNALTGDCYCECVGAGDITIKDNGYKSTNNVIVRSMTSNMVVQKSKTAAETTVYSKAKTGGNKANKNTDSGEFVKTGNAKSVVSVSVTGGSNAVVNP